MNLEQATAIKQGARRTGTLKFTAAQRAEFNEASEIVHQHLMETDLGYARGFRDCYNRLAASVGRNDLVGRY